MPFYIVKTTVVAVVEASTPHDAIVANQMEWSDICRDSNWFPDAEPQEITHIREMPESWDGECLPYNGDGVTRLKDLLMG